MPFQALTKEPTALAGLDAGKTYRGEVRAKVTVFFRPSATVPSADNSEADSVRPEDFDRRFEIVKTADQEMYVWAGGGPEPLGSVQYREI